MHIEQVLGDVPKDQRCRCREQKADAKRAARAASGPSWLDRLLGH
jgi:GTP cyclohydrolase II